MNIAAGSLAGLIVTEQMRFIQGEACTTGKYSSSNICIDCAAGKFSDAVGASVASTCGDCGAGKYSAADASTVCTDCAAGKFSDAVGASVASTCADCEAGKYSAADASTVCTNCTANSNSMTGSDAALDCICNAGFTSDGAGGNPATKLCRKCPINTYKDWAGDQVRA